MSDSVDVNEDIVYVQLTASGHQQLYFYYSDSCRKSFWHGWLRDVDGHRILDRFNRPTGWWQFTRKQLSLCFEGKELAEMLYGPENTTKPIFDKIDQHEQPA